MPRRLGRCRRGERLRAGVSQGHWKTTALVADMRRTGMVAPMMLDGPINRNAFVADVRQVLVPGPSPNGRHRYHGQYVETQGSRRSPGH